MKKMTIEQLQNQLNQLQKAYDEKLKKERLKIGERVQKATGLNSAKVIFDEFTLVRKGADNND